MDQWTQKDIHNWSSLTIRNPALVNRPGDERWQVFKIIRLTVDEYAPLHSPKTMVYPASHWLVVHMVFARATSMVQLLQCGGHSVDTTQYRFTDE